MADDELDPIASTQMFRAFVERDEERPSVRKGVILMVGGLVVLVIVLAVSGWLLVR
jgi:hypothetical protein